MAYETAKERKTARALTRKAWTSAQFGGRPEAAAAAAMRWWEAARKELPPAPREVSAAKATFEALHRALREGTKAGVMARVREAVFASRGGTFPAPVSRWEVPELTPGGTPEPGVSPDTSADGEDDGPRCAACGAAWPCATPGGVHISRGELEARVLAEDGRRTGPDMSGKPHGDPDPEDAGPCCEGPCEHEAEAAEEARRDALADAPLPEPAPRPAGDGFRVSLNGIGAPMLEVRYRSGPAVVVSPGFGCGCEKHGNLRLDEDVKRCAVRRAREFAAAPDLAEALREMVLCFGSGPETDEWWAARADEAAGSDAPGSADDIRASVLRFARSTYADAYRVRA